MVKEDGDDLVPTLNYDKKDLLRLLKKKIRDDELVEIINSIKPNVERIDEETVTVEHTADRPDLFGIEGLARAINQWLGFKSRFRVSKPKLEVRVERVPVRPHVACAVLRRIKLTDELVASLMNIQEILHETIGRKRKKVAIGVHDLDKIFPPIVYRGASKEERMVPLGLNEEMSLAQVIESTQKGREYGKLVCSSRLWPVWVDSKGIFSFPPVINSDRTKVTRRTRNLFLDVTGTNKKAVRQTLNLLTTNLAERGAKIESVKIVGKRIDVLPDLSQEVIEISVKEASKLIGTELKEKQVANLLRRMGYEVLVHGAKIEVFVPAYRVDILHRVDVYEDIAIAYGLNKLKPELPSVFTIGCANPLERLSARVREVMIGLGFVEVMRTILTNETKQFRRMNLKPKSTVEIENPVSKEYTELRTWLLPSLLEVLAKNKHVAYPQKIFEVGDVVLPDGKAETKSLTLRRVAGAIAKTNANFAEIKAVTQTLLKNFGVKYKLKANNHESFIKGRYAEILSDGLIGFFGEVSPAVLSNWKIEMPTTAFEISLSSLEPAR